MLQVQIDGKPVEVEQGTSVLEAAKAAGTYIPHFCYHKKLSIAASCRMCLVEVEKAPKPLPACATTVSDGMIVHTHSEKAKQAQQGVMEFLLINHPLDCPVCDQGGECQLQDLAFGYGQGGSRFTEGKPTVKAKNMGPLISAEEMSRCIHCTRCVRFTEEIAGFQEIAMANRNEHSEIMPFIGKTVTSEVSGNVIDLCPVGALTSKPFRFAARSWELSRRKSIAAHDSLGSHLIVQTHARQVVRVLPLENESINECWLSDRDRFSYQGLNHQNRLTQPKIKQNNEWIDVNWETALAYVTKGLTGVASEHGKQSVGFWVNPASTVEELYLAKMLAQKLGVTAIDSRLRQQDDRLDRARQSSLWLGQKIEEIAQNQAILVIGADLRAEQPLLTVRIRQAAKKGTKVSTLHARQETLNMPVCEQAAVHPSRWVEFLKTLIEDNGKSAISGSLKDAEKALIILGASAQQHPQFAEIYTAAQLLAQTYGANIGVLPVAANSVAADLLHIRPNEGAKNLRDMILQPQKAVVLVNVDPQADVVHGVAAMKALQSAETVIALTAYQTPSLLATADVLLPICPWTETSGSLINMEGKIQSFHGVVQPLGEARPMWKVLRVLGNRLNLEGFDYTSSQEVLKAAFPEGLEGRLGNLQNIHLEASSNGTSVLWRIGGVGLYDNDAVVRHAQALQQTPQAQIPEARIHSKTLEHLGLQTGESAYAWQNDSEKITLKVVADDAIAENVVYLPTHEANRGLGALMNTIELKRGE